MPALCCTGPQLPAGALGSHSKATGVQVTPPELGHMPHAQRVFSPTTSSVKKQAGFIHCVVQIAGLHPPCKCGSGNSVCLSQKHLPGKLVFSFSCWYCGPLRLVCCPVSQAAGRYIPGSPSPLVSDKLQSSLGFHPFAAWFKQNLHFN